MELNIKLTDEQEKLLRKFATDHYPNSEKNYATHHPLFVVETRKERIVNPDYDTVNSISFYVYDWGEGFSSAEDLIETFWDYNDTECPIEIKPFNKVINTYMNDCNGHITYIADENDYLNAYNFNLNYDIGYMGHYYEPVAYFFVLEEAKRYMEYQSHNLTDPRVNCYGAGYANYGDYHHFYQLLMSIGTQLIKEEVEEDILVEETSN